nr:MAG TPA: hypothetical protein [Caudoviricetes sp.]
MMYHRNIGMLHHQLPLHLNRPNYTRKKRHILHMYEKKIRGLLPRRLGKPHFHKKLFFDDIHTNHSQGYLRWQIVYIHRILVYYSFLSSFTLK